MSPEEIAKIEEEAQERFSLQRWLEDASRRAGQMSMSTHPYKLSHPSAKATPVIYEGNYEADGLLRSGNVRDIELDALGNAGALDVYKLLDLRMDDGRRLIEHIKEESEIGRAVVLSAGGDYETVRNGFLAMLESSSDEMVTSSKIKQVYFPVDEVAYHLLSIITNAGIIHRMRILIDEMRFGDEAKALREDRKKGECAEDHREIYDLSVLKYGGDHPKNVSVLNNTMGGLTYLLRSMPPELAPRGVRFPKRDFFKEALFQKEAQARFESLGKIAATDYNNVNIRNARIRHYEMLLEFVIESMWRMRVVSEAQFYEPTSHLPTWQKIWLVEAYRDKRTEDESWLKEVKEAIGRWIVAGIERYGPKDLKLGLEELDDIHKVIEAYKEGLR
jgi:CRISPR-associated protein Csy1